MSTQSISWLYFHFPAHQFAGRDPHQKFVVELNQREVISYVVVVPNIITLRRGVGAPGAGVREFPITFRYRRRFLAS